MLRKKENKNEDIAFQREFGEYIKRARETQHLYQQQVAEQLGITQQYYSHIENGTRNVDFVVAVKICNVLNLNVNEFIARYIK